MNAEMDTEMDAEMDAEIEMQGCTLYKGAVSVTMNGPPPVLNHNQAREFPQTTDMCRGTCGACEGKDSQGEAADRGLGLSSARGTPRVDMLDMLRAPTFDVGSQLHGRASQALLHKTKLLQYSPERIETTPSYVHCF